MSLLFAYGKIRFSHDMALMFSNETISTFKTDKSQLKQSYEKENLTLVVISYEVYETHQRLVS